MGRRNKSGDDGGEGDVKNDRRISPVISHCDVIYEHPLVDPQLSHFRQVPLRTMVKLPHSEQDFTLITFHAGLGPLINGWQGCRFELIIHNRHLHIGKSQ